MTIYVESNFVLESALGQEQSEAAEALLVLAEEGAIELALPSFAVSEPFATITHRSRNRRKLSGELSNEIKELARSIPHRQDVTVLDLIPALLAQIANREANLLVATVERLLQSATIIELDLPTFRGAMHYRGEYSLSEQDSIIFASVIEHLKERTGRGIHYFVSKNWRDFGAPTVRQELGAHDCLFLDRFDDAVSMVKRQKPS